VSILFIKLSKTKSVREQIWVC